jgi:hypothetical protein
MIPKTTKIKSMKPLPQPINIFQIKKYKFLCLQIFSVGLSANNFDKPHVSCTFIFEKTAKGVTIKNLSSTLNSI